jgi:hypothetical protein
MRTLALLTANFSSVKITDRLEFERRSDTIASYFQTPPPLLPLPTELKRWMPKIENPAIVRTEGGFGAMASINSRREALTQVSC